jgi:carbamoyltransferase
MVPCRETLLAYLPVPPERVIEPALPAHHLAHAYSAYGTSPFARPAVLVIDEQGHHLDDRFEKCSWFHGSTGPLRLLGQFFGGGDELSLGMFYNAFAFLTGLNEAGMPAAGKLMGLAALGRVRPEWPELIALDRESGDARVSAERLDEFFTEAGLPVRPAMSDFTALGIERLRKFASVGWDTGLAANLARKAEDELERAVLHIAGALRQRSGADTLAYAGGVALNCTTNRRLREAGWSDVYVHPAATDDGNAVGLALFGWIETLGQPRPQTAFFSPFTGRSYGQDDTRRAFDTFGLNPYTRDVSASDAGADRVARGDIVCWFQGTSEWGPRALGARSIVASPLIAGMRDRINSRIKYREPYRPFGISGTPEGLAELVDTSAAPASLRPYMLAVGRVKDDRLAEVRHADGLVRYQVVSADVRPTWHRLIEEFGRRTGVFAVINTSFNTLGEPLVETPTDAVRQFLISKADALIVENTLLARADIPEQPLKEACAKAWAASAIHPLLAAMGLAAAGHPEAAVNLLEQMAYTDETAKPDGPEALQLYYGLLLRVAQQRQDLDAVRAQVDNVLRWAALSPQAAQAAEVMAGETFADGRQMAGRLIGTFARPGGALDFFTGILVKPPESSS